MIEEIINKYEAFSDSLISGICYKRTVHDEGQIEVILTAMNSINDYKFEKIKLIFDGIYKFRFIEVENTSSLVINLALIKKEEGVITIDFFPLIFSEGLKENDESDFIIKCKELSYERIIEA